MKYIFKPFLMAVLLSAALSMSLSCDRESQYVGTEVKFKASSENGESRGTKAIYGSDNGTISQNIEWEVNDSISIRCAQCPDLQACSYRANSVHPDGTASNSFATIVHVGSQGLKWGEGTHTFYAMYPDTTHVSGASLKGKDGVCIIPATQGIRGAVSGTTCKVASPDLKNLWMSAKNTLTAAPTDGSVLLDFKTLSTALEFTIKNGFSETESTMKVNSISLKSAAHAICGTFKVDMDQNGLYGRPKTSLPSGTTVADCDSVSINFGSSPVSVAYGDSLRFTFFLNPGNSTEVNDLTFEIRGTGKDDADFVRSAVLKRTDGTGVTFSSHKKTRIEGLLVPESASWAIGFEVIVTPWITDSGAEVYIN